MTIIVNQELCRGCGTCAEACPHSAIFLREGKAFVDQSKCTSCQVCLESCPTGALRSFSTLAPISVVKPDLVDVIEPRYPVSPSLPAQPGWGQTALAFVGQYVLPRLVDILGTFFEHKLAPSNPKQSTSTPTRNRVDSRPMRQRRQHHGRFTSSR